MARFTVNELLNAFKTELSTKYEIEPAIRYFRVGDVAELATNAPAYYLEPGTYTVNRQNVGSPEIVQTVRFLSEQRVNYGDAAAAIAATLAFFEQVSRDLMRTPNFGAGAAFLRGVSSYSDAPGGFSVASLEDGVAAVFGGLEFAFSIA